MRQEGLHARFGLQLVHHQRALEAGEAAMGVYSFCVLFSRLNELDGFVPRVAAERCWTCDPENSGRLARLVEVGFLRETEAGFIVCHYEEFNETKAEIAARRQASRERKQRHRSAGKSAPPPPVAPPPPPPAPLDSPSRARAVTRDSRVTPASVTDSDSLSGSDLKGEVQEGRPPPVRGLPRTPDAVATPPPEDVPIDEALVGSCAMAGYPRPTRAHVQAMLARARARGLRSHDWPGEVVLWMSRERQFARPPSPELARAAPPTATPDARATARMLRERERTERVDAPADFVSALDALGGG